MAHPRQMSFCKRVKNRFPNDFIGKKVLDVGSLDINGNNRYLFEDCDYTGIDLGAGENVDIVCKAHEHKGLYGTIISTEAFEHDPYIKESLNNIISNLLKPGGLFVFTCAGEGRSDHGTKSHHPYSAPFTNDHYMNLSEEIVMALVDIDFWFGERFRFESDLNAKDLYFVGRKEGASLDYQAPFWAFPKVSIIIPIIRPDKAERCIEAIKKNAGIPIDQYEIVTSVDTEAIGCPKMVEKLVARTKYECVMFLGDDTVPLEGFVKHALNKMDEIPGGWGVVGLNTEDPTGQNTFAHWMAHKKMLDHFSDRQFFNTAYRHCWCDIELRDIASDMDRWLFSEDSLIQHDHPVNTGKAFDEGYARAYSDEAKQHDLRTYFYRKRERVKDGIALCLPCTYEKVYTHFMFSLIALERHYSRIIAPSSPGPLDAVRNDLVVQALFQGCTHILMMDTDQIYNTVGLVKQLESHDLPMVGGLVYRRYPPFDPLALRQGEQYLDHVSIEEIERGGLVEVDATGCGCVLYDTRVFIDMMKSLDEKWFEFSTGNDGRPVGEDIGFCRKLKEMGHKIFVDCDVDIKHLSLLSIDLNTHKLYNKLREVSQNGRE